MTQVRSWLSRRSRWLWPGITAVAVAVAVMSVVAARPGGDGERLHEAGPRERNECAEMAALVGAADCAALEAAVFDGQSLAQVAAANGVERQTVVDAITAKINEDIDAALADGELTETQANRFRDSIAEKVAYWVDQGREHRGPGPGEHNGRGHDNIDAEDCNELAALLGTDCETLKTSIADGQTPAEIAQANGIEPQTVIDALVARLSAEIDAKVADGDLTEAKAATFRETLTEHITNFVNNGERAMHGDAGMRNKQGRGHDNIDAEDCNELAALLGTDCETLKTSIADGQTPAAIAQANGIEPQTVIDALVARLSAEIDAKVADGHLTEAKAAEFRTMLTEHITNFVNNGERAMHGDGMRGMKR